MSLLVHELLIGTGGGGNNASTIQASPANPVPIASVTVTHSNSTVQVAHIQQSRVVTITSNQSRLTPSEKGSRLADALAGNPPYSYSSNTQQRFARSHVAHRNFVSHSLPSPAVSSSQLDNLKPLKALPSSRQTYALPFVLQDHNYGAPPPPTPPHSPPPPPPPIVASTSAITPYSYKVHQIFSPTTTTSSTTSPKILSSHISSPTKTHNQYAKIASVTSEQSVLTINNAGTVQISNSNGGVVGTSNSTSSVVAASHIMATMPLHRQQFMPQPKPHAYSAPHIPISPSAGESLASQAITLPSNGGQDTDEESRLSDRSSSVGPSGEETETAPEGEGEEQIQGDDSITRCICNFTHDDGYMIQCDRCFVWQHVDCMEIDRNNIPDEYLCEACKPRITDKSKARALQVRRRQEIRAHLARVSSSDSEDNILPQSRSKTSSSGKSQDRKVLKKKKPKTSKENKNSRKHASTSNKTSILCSSTNNVKSDQSLDERDAKPSLVKSRRRQSTLSGSSQSGGEDGCNNSTFTLEQLRSWIEDYEVAVTNHYSPELRAKVHAARINGISAEFRESTQGALLGHRCRVAPCYDVGPESFEDKILVAATRLQVGTAIIEYQGKYTLKSQWNAMQIPSGLPYLPFVLQYNMQKEGFNVCVDARTYGNDARFARRSSQFNAEIRHVVERGSVHLYIVACKEIEEEEEILLPLETAVCQQSVPSKVSTNAQISSTKIDGNESNKEELSKLTSNNSQVRKNGILHNNKKTMRKPLLSLSLPQPINRISRRATSSDGYTCEEIANPAQNISPVKQRRASGCGGNRSPAKCILKSPSKSPTKIPIEDSSSGESPLHESPGSGDKCDSHKMTREERKIAAYMKAFERMEKAAQRRQEMEKKKIEDKEKRQNNNEDEEGSRNDELNKYILDKEGKKGKKSNKGSPNKLLSNDFSEEENYGSSSEGERIKLCDGSLQVYGSPPSSGINNMGFRFPKTKKALMNEWLNETIDPVLHSPSLGGEIATGVPTCYMRSPSTSVRRGGATVSSGSVGIVEMAGRSAKKRWLRQAIIDETEPQNVGLSMCSSPNSRPDSPIGAGDYITPLKKRRLARESMSSEQSNTPPSTPLHSGLEEKYNEEMELDHASDDNADADEEKDVKLEENFDGDCECKEIKKEEICQSNDDEDFKTDVSDRLTINISKLESKDVESEPEKIKSETSGDFLSVKIENKSVDIKSECVEDEGKSIAIHDDTLCEEKDNLNISITKEKEEREDQKQSKKVSKSSKSRKKTRKKVIKYRNLDKNRNMQRKRKVIKTSKIKKKKTKSKKLKENPNLEQCSPPKGQKTPTKVSIPNNSKGTSAQSNNTNLKLEETVLKNVITEYVKDVKTDDVKKISLELNTKELQGPKTPEGTPPETPLKTDYLENTTCNNDDSLLESENIKDADLISSNATCIPKSQSEMEEAVGNAELSSKSDCLEKYLMKSGECNFSSVVSLKPAAFKRKLSILEYRKRKSISCERDPNDDSEQKGTSAQNTSVEAYLDVDVSIPSTYPVENLKSSKFQDGLQAGSGETKIMLEDLQSKPLTARALSPSIPNTTSAKLEKDDSKDVKWNAAPTLLEQQRENLTARLRREFGLCLPEDSPLKMKLGDQSTKDKWIDFEKKYPFAGKKVGGMKTSLSLSSSNTEPKCPVTTNSECQAFHTAEVKPIPLPLTFEKLNNSKLPPECDPRVINDLSQSISLSATLDNPSDFEGGAVQCEVEGKNIVS